MSRSQVDRNPRTEFSRLGQRQRQTSGKDVLAAFNTWAFKREKPSDPIMLGLWVEKAIQKSGPVPFVLYWGKGPRLNVTGAELECLAYLTKMADRIRACHHAGARFDLVFTDTHARLNGHSEHAMTSYFSAVESVADRQLFHTHRLGAIVERTNAAALDKGVADPDTLERLERCATKWFRGEGSASQGARRYFALNMIEKRAMEIAFPESIFVTFNGSEYRSLFPDALPIFYMYSLRKGFAVKPWFISEPTSEGAEVSVVAV